MEQLNLRNDTEAIWEGKFLESLDVQDHINKTIGMRNMINLQQFTELIRQEEKFNSAIALAGGLGTELFIIQPKHAVLVEINQRLLNKAFDFTQNLKFDLEALKYDITKLPLPFKDKEFDLVIINSAIEHIPNIYELVDEMKRIGHNFFIGSIPIGDPPLDHLHVWKWKDRNDVLSFTKQIRGHLIGSYWAHYDILWRESWD